MSSSPTVATASQHFIYASHFCFVAKHENMGRIAKHPFQTAAQIFQGWQALYFIDSTLKALGKDPIPTPHRWAVFALPPVALLLSVVLPKGQSLRNGAGILIRTAVLVSQVALVYFTGSGAAIAALSCMTINLLARNRVLPESAARAYSVVETPIYFLAQFFSAASLGAALQNIAQFFFIREQMQGFPICSKIAAVCFPSFVQGNKLVAEIMEEGALNGALFRQIQDAPDPRTILRPLNTFASIPQTTPLELDDLFTLWNRPKITQEARSFLDRLSRPEMPQLWLVLQDLKSKPKADRLRFVEELNAGPRQALRNRFNALIEQPIPGDRDPLKTRICRALAIERELRFAAQPNSEMPLRDPSDIILFLRNKIPGFNDQVASWWKTFIRRKEAPLPPINPLFPQIYNAFFPSAEEMQAIRLKQRDELLPVIAQTQRLEQLTSDELSRQPLVATDGLILGMLVEMGVLCVVKPDQVGAAPPN